MGPVNTEYVLQLLLKHSSRLSSSCALSAHSFFADNIVSHAGMSACLTSDAWYMFNALAGLYGAVLQRRRAIKKKIHIFFVVFFEQTFFVGLT